jgi:hypothetical protein
VVDGVLDRVSPRPYDGELGRRIRGVGVAQLRGDRAARGDDHVLVAAGAPDADPVLLVGFVIDTFVGLARSEPMPPYGVRAPGIIDGDVVDGEVVGGPGGTGTDSADFVVEPFAGS